MKIKKIEVGNFGKLKDTVINFDDGVQIVYGENENGKSTLMEFIKMMFYGDLGKSMNAAVRENRTPWDGGELGGAIEFEDKGKLYRIQKKFDKKTPLKDKVTFQCLSDGQIISLGKKEEIGDRVFGFSLEDFQRSGYISCLGEGEFSNKKNSRDMILNLIDTGDENVSKEISEERLDKAIRELKWKNGSGGYIVELKKKTSNLKAELCELERLNKEQENIKNKINQIDIRIKERERLREKVNSIKFKKLNSYLEHQRHLKIKKEEYNAQIEILNSEYGEKLKNHSEYKNKLLYQKEKTKKKFCDNLKYSVIVALILLFLSIFSFIFFPVFIPFLIVSFLIDIVFAVIVFSKYKNTTKELESNIFEEENKINFDKDRIYKEIMEIENKISSLERNDEQHIEISDLILNLTDMTSTGIENDTEKLKKQIDFQKIKEYENVNDYEKLKDDLCALESLDLDEKKDLLKSKIITFQKTVPDLKEELIEVESQLKNRESYLRSLEMAKVILNNSYNELKEKVGPQINQRTSEILSCLTAGKYNDISIQDDCSIFIKTGVYNRKHDIFSSGTIDQAYFSFRLALSEIISRSNTIPLILDDILVRYDNKRLHNTLKYLKQYALNNDCQIIIFTCHEHIAESAELLAICRITF